MDNPASCVPARRPDRRLLASASFAGLAFVLALLGASAAMRLGSGELEAATTAALRTLHRACASLEALALLAAGALAWRQRLADPGMARAATAAAILTLFLALLGAATGRNPPPVAAAGNLLGGLALAACFAWMLGRAGGHVRPVRSTRGLRAVAVLAAAQCALGAWMSLSSTGVARPAAIWFHAPLGVAIAALGLWIALRIEESSLRRALVATLLAAPASGLVVILPGEPLGYVLAHAAGAASLVVGVAYANGRFA